MKNKLLKEKKVRLLLVSFITLLVIALTVLTSLYLINNGKLRNLKVEFNPEDMKSCPDHTAWLVASISFSGEIGNEVVKPIIEINTSIDYEYTLWNKSSSPCILELFLYPTEAHIGTAIEILVSVNIQEESASDTAIVNVVNWTLTDQACVEPMKNTFVTYLSSDCSVFQINESTVWEGFWSGIEIIVVQHYLFKSKYWEMELSWHATMEPHDWVQIYLRKRWESTPIWAGKISSWGSDNHSILEIDPPTEIYR